MNADCSVPRANFVCSSFFLSVSGQFIQMEGGMAGRKERRSVLITRMRTSFPTDG